jgi:DNA primase
MSFHEAVAFLAERAGMPLPQMANDEDFALRRKQRERLYAALREAALFYHKALLSDEGAKARGYLDGRGVGAALVRRFGIGLAPAQWQRLSDHMTGLGFSEKELVACGLTATKDGRRYDFFRDKVMFPIIDQRSRVLGFGGRALSGDGPKYINTADTPVYNKREMLYGLNFYRSFGAERELVVVEGYMDLIALYAAGIKNAVASLGTALTPGQVRLMRRFADTIFIAYDGDAAGRNATLRGLDLVEREGVGVRVLMLPEGMDPDDVINKRGTAAFAALKNEALTLTDFKLERLKEQFDMTDEDARMQFARQAAALLKTASPVERERYLKTVARLSGFSVKALMLETNAQGQQGRAEIRAASRAAAFAAPPEEDEVAVRMLSLMAADPRVRARAYLMLTEEDFAKDLHRAMFRFMAELHQDDCSAALLSRFDEPEQAAAAAAVLSARHSATDRMVADYIDGLRLRRLAREVDALNQQCKETGADVLLIATEIQKRMMAMESLRNKRLGGATGSPLFKGETR